MDRTFAVSALANLSAAFNFTVTSQLLILIQLSGVPPSDLQKAVVGSATIAGAIAGQLLFGFIGQSFVRKDGLLAVALGLCTIGNVCAAFLCWEPLLFSSLAFFRFVSGMGSGGVYPLSAAASFDSSTDPSTTGRRMMLVFSFQGVGQVLAHFSVVMLDLMLPLAPSASWRTALLLGGIPSAYAARLALMPQEEVRNERVLSSASSESVQQQQHPPVVSCRNSFLLVGTGGSWLVFDILFYGNIIFTPYVLEKVFGLNESHPNKLAVAGYSCLIFLAALPGLYLASLLSETLGRKNIQLIGFSACALLFFILSWDLDNLHESILFCMYLATFFFYNFGPNATTFCLPAETFPANSKVLYNGISAALGKIGGLIGAAAFSLILDERGLGYLLWCCCATAVLGVVVTALFVQDRRVSKRKDLIGTAMATELVQRHDSEDSNSREDGSTVIALQ